MALTHSLMLTFYTASLAVSLVGFGVTFLSIHSPVNIIWSTQPHSPNTQRFNHLATKQPLANYKLHCRTL